MFPKLKKVACATALSASLVLIIPAVVSAQDRDRREDQREAAQNRDWANNSYYQMGAREGMRDHQRNRRRNHRHKFRSEDDRRAYTAGYDTAWQGNQDRDRDRRERPN